MFVQKVFGTLCLGNRGGGSTYPLLVRLQLLVRVGPGGVAVFVQQLPHQSDVQVTQQERVLPDDRHVHTTAARVSFRFHIKAESDTYMFH